MHVDISVSSSRHLADRCNWLLTNKHKKEADAGASDASRFSLVGRRGRERAAFAESGGSLPRAREARTAGVCLRASARHHLTIRERVSRVHHSYGACERRPSRAYRRPQRARART
ncbi:hypothetical protein SRHO_G00214140 [Serrasalmus rhombeus]